LDVDDVLVADQAYGSYIDLALVQQQQADGVFRKHHARHTDFRRGHKSGIGDHQVVWQKPKTCPTHLTQTEFEAVPETLLVREVCLRLARRGWRDEPIIVVTTLLDAKRYSAKQLTQLYGWRWAAAEVNLRHLKTTLKMAMLSAKTPEMSRAANQFDNACIDCYSNKLPPICSPDARSGNWAVIQTGDFGNVVAV
jgi:hypothetical protein